MIPIHLRISGFLSYRDPVDLDFTGLDLACISGSNGAGKSTILDAITWALFGIARKRDDSLINSACSSAEVVFTFTYEDNVYRIQRARPREKTGLLDFFVHSDPQAFLQNPQAISPNGVWRSLTEHSIRETEQTIKNTLRMDFETFTNASFFLQGKADQFAIQAPGDRKRILGSILGLDIWETYRLDAVERRKALEVECTTLDGRLHEIITELAEGDARRVLLGELETRLNQQSQARRVQEESLESLRRLKQAL
ncbi:MAG: SMC family ATPase, partial [Chloroflexota bacterium]